MKLLFQFTALLLLTGAIGYLSCKKEYSCENCRDVNKPPIANAGRDTTIVLPIDSVRLDGSASTDPDGSIINFQWIKISGPASFSINNGAVAKIIVKNLVAGAYQFELKVTDDSGLSAKDTMQINVKDPAQPNRPPVANAGADQTIISQVNNVNLDGSGSVDPDNNISSYEWTKISGPISYSISNSKAAQTQVITLGPGTYFFELKVTDAGGLFSKDTVQVTVDEPAIVACDNSNRPIVNAQLVPIGTLSHSRVGMAVASAGNKVLFAGASLSEVSGSSTPEYGSSKVDIYDRVTQAWSTAELSKWRSDIAAVAAGNKVFFAGGRLGDGAFDSLYSTVDIYDASTNNWSTASLSEPRAYIAAAAVGNKVFFAGGEKDWNYNTSGTVDIYDISTNSWSTKVLSEPRAYISAVTENNKVYFAGGQKEDRWYADPSNRIDIYDNATNSWSTSSLNKPMGFLTGINQAEKLYWANGCSVEIKDVNTWKSLTANLFKPGEWITDEGQNTVVKNNKIVFFTGRRGGNKFDIYDVTTNTWSIGVLPQSIYAASIISVNNTIYVAGGILNGGNFSNMSNQVWKLEF
ncbi:MAG: PKD domain-containing protein [Chitinophagaceae bacterium]